MVKVKKVKKTEKKNKPKRKGAMDPKKSKPIRKKINNGMGGEVC